MPADFAAHVRAETEAFAAVLAAAVTDPALLDRPVLSCPGWNLYDLADHLGGVHRWVVTAIEDGHGRGSSDPAPRDPAALHGWFTDGAAALRAALDGDPDRPAWSFSREPGHDRLAFWQRRQAHENLIHRWDAQAATGAPGPIDTDLAVDGIAEVLEVFVPRMRVRGLLGPLPQGVRLEASDAGQAWVLGDDPGQVVATVTGPAAGLLLHLWKRAGDTEVTWSGDAEAGRAVLAHAVTP